MKEIAIILTQQNRILKIIKAMQSLQIIKLRLWVFLKILKFAILVV